MAILPDAVGDEGRNILDGTRPSCVGVEVQVWEALGEGLFSKCIDALLEGLGYP